MSLPPREGPDDGLLATYFEKRANLVRFFAARTGSLAAAEDLAQDLYVKLATVEQPIEAQNAVALIYRIATNLMLDEARGKQRSAARERAWREATVDTRGGEALAREPPADEAAASRQRLRQLVEAAAQLPPQMCRAFRLHKLEGLSQADTARQMGLSVKAVEKHVAAALRTLTRKLSP
jgi:RNA polymerase sigma factor (sigma-70 family)